MEREKGRREGGVLGRVGGRKGGRGDARTGCRKCPPFLVIARLLFTTATPFLPRPLRLLLSVHIDVRKRREENVSVSVSCAYLGLTEYYSMGQGGKVLPNLPAYGLRRLFGHLKLVAHGIRYFLPSYQ